VAIALAIYLVPAPDGLSTQGKTSWAVFILCTGLWVSNAVPFGITGLLAIALLAATGAMKASEAFAAFGNSAVFFLIGVFIIAAALIESGLSKRCALLFLRPFERSPYAFATGMLLAGAFGTMWMPNQARPHCFPIAEVALALRLQGQERVRQGPVPVAGMGAMIGSTQLPEVPRRAGDRHVQEKHESGFHSQWVSRRCRWSCWDALRALCPGSASPGKSPSRRREVLEEAVRGKVYRRRQWSVATSCLLTIAAWVILGNRVTLR
jgi:hypothetical protein